MPSVSRTCQSTIVVSRNLFVILIVNPGFNVHKVSFISGKILNVMHLYTTEVDPLSGDSTKVRLGGIPMSRTRELMYKISILVPVYNVEHYIERCIRSIQEQTFKDFECIIVNDCTPDKSMEIVSSLVQNDSRFRIMHHEVNKGLGESRNTGIRNAGGEYITFIDSDDHVEPGYLEQLYDAITVSQAKIVEGRIVGRRYSNPYHVLSNNKESNYHNVISQLLSGTSDHAIVNKMYKRSLFNNFTLPSRSYEDVGANLLIVARNKITKIPRTQQAGYIYDTSRVGSITKACNSALIDDYVENVLHCPVVEFSQHGYDWEYLHKYLCFYEAMKMVDIIRIILQYSQSPNTHFAYLRSKIQNTMPNFVSSFFQVRDLFSSMCLVKTWNSRILLVGMPFVRVYFDCTLFRLFLSQICIEIPENIQVLRKTVKISIECRKSVKKKVSA